MTAVSAAAVGLVAVYFGAALVTALVPWVNAEVLMATAVPIARSRPHLLILVGAVASGQMAGKSIVYWISRRSVGDGMGGRARRAIDRWRVRLEGRPLAASGVMFLSAVTGVPPFFATSIAAGLARVPFPAFVAIGLLGRLVHFSAIAFAAGLWPGGWW